VSPATTECSLRTSLSSQHQSLNLPARMSLSSGDLNNEQLKKKSSVSSCIPQYLSNRIPQGSSNLRSMPPRSEQEPSFTNVTPQSNEQTVQTNLDQGDQWDFTPRNSPQQNKITPSMTANSWQSCTVSDAGRISSKEQKSPSWSIQTMRTYSTIGTPEKLVPRWLATCQKGSNTTSYWNTNLALQTALTPYHGDLTTKGQTLTMRIS